MRHRDILVLSFGDDPLILEGMVLDHALAEPDHLRRLGAVHGDVSAGDLELRPGGRGLQELPVHRIEIGAGLRCRLSIGAWCCDCERRAHERQRKSQPGDGQRPVLSGTPCVGTMVPRTLHVRIAPGVGLEPTTYGLTVRRSAD
jgi:hypothetical protein